MWTHGPGNIKEREERIIRARKMEGRGREGTRASFFAAEWLWDTQAAEQMCSSRKKLGTRHFCPSPSQLPSCRNWAWPHMLGLMRAPFCQDSRRSGFFLVGSTGHTAGGCSVTELQLPRGVDSTSPASFLPALGSPGALALVCLGT